MNKSEQINELAAALAKAQAKFKPAPKRCKNPFFKSNYADLDAVVEVSRPHLTENGLAVSQLPAIKENGDVVLVIMLMHTSGQWISGEYPIKPIKGDPQSMGGAFTYARRYSYSGLTGVVTEDEDGEEAMGREKAHVEPRNHPQVSSQDYQIGFGKHQGKHLSDLPNETLESYYYWILNQAKEKNQTRETMSEMVQEFLSRAEKYLGVYAAI